MMKKYFLYKTVILSGLLMVFSCTQDPIFYKVSTETIPEKPRIPGAPTNMVVFERNDVPIMYVASGRLHWYAKTEEGTGAWDLADHNIPQPGGKVICLAVTREYLYALSISSSGATTTLRRIGHDENDTWNEIKVEESTYTLIQSIYTDEENDKLFAGAMNNKGRDFGILYLDDTSDPPVLRLLFSDTEMLSGAASLSGVHYLSTRGKGVYKITEMDLPTIAKPIPIEESDNYRLKDLENPEDEKKRNRLFMGMIKLEDPNPSAIIVVERNGGAFFEVQSDGFKRIKYNNPEKVEFVSTGRFATGALAIWENINNPAEKMFIAGIQGGLYITASTTSYTHGYTEFDLDYQESSGFKKDSDGWLFLDSTRRNNSPSITVDLQTERYSATIGKHPINHMYQVPESIDANMIFFASTQTGGLWSYRNRSDGIQWNAEK
jgi:hypothetical protein